MALVKYGGGVASMSGKLGGTVAARNRAGAYFRNWAFPTNEPTASQTQQRTTFAAVSTAWATLALGDKNDWESWASGLVLTNRQGDEYIPTGRQMFMSCNTNLSVINETLLDSPPTGSTPPAIDSRASIIVKIDGSTLDLFEINDAGIDSTNVIQVWGAPEQNTGKINLTLLYRVIGFYAESEFLDVTADYTAMFGNTGTIGSVMKVKMRTVDPATGLSSPFLIVETVTIPL